MKKQLILVLAISTLSLIGCEEVTIKPTEVKDLKPAQPTTISSFYPEAGTSGIVVAIFGENFGPSASDNYVTFNGMYSEILEVQRGIITVRVPLNLAQGDYEINVSALGQTATSTKTFKVNRY